PRRHLRARLLLAVAVLAALAWRPATAQAQIAFYADLGSEENNETTNVPHLSFHTSTEVPAVASIIVVTVIYPPVDRAIVLDHEDSCEDSQNTPYTTDVNAWPRYAILSICSTHRIASPLPAGPRILLLWDVDVEARWGLRMRAFAVTGLASQPFDRTAY